jgi:hypothetical protein
LTIEYENEWSGSTRTTSDPHPEERFEEARLEGRGP